MNKIIAIDLGGTSAKLAFVRSNGEILTNWKLATDISQNGQLIIPNLIESIKEKLNSENISLNDIKGIGMGTPGAVDVEAKTVTGAYNLNWESKQEVGKAFEDAFGKPFFIDNDANVAALGEQWLGAGKSYSDVVMVTLGTGVGGGVIVDGKLLHGAGAAGEIGHMPVDFTHQLECTCGNSGCLETVASATGVVNLYNYYVDKWSTPSSLISKVKTGTELSAKLILDEGRSGDSFAEKIVDLVAFYLAVGCANIASVINPHMIVLGGGLSQAGDYLLNQVEGYFEKFVHKAVLENNQFKLATLGNDAGVIGASQLVNLAVDE